MDIKNVTFGEKIKEFLKTKFKLVHLYSDCNDRSYHLHKYVKDGLVRYFPKEKLNYRGYKWTDEYVYVSRDEEELVNFEQRKELIKINDNIEYLNAERESKKDFVEYQYEYTETWTTMQPVQIGKTTSYYPVIHEETEYDWTSNPKHSGLTGLARTGHHVYVAYKVERNKRGKLTLVESPEVENLIDIKDEYPYITEDHIVINYTKFKLEEEETKEEEDNKPISK